MDLNFRLINWIGSVFSCCHVEVYTAICLTFYLQTNFKQTRYLDKTYAYEWSDDLSIIHQEIKEDLKLKLVTFKFEVSISLTVISACSMIEKEQSSILMINHCSGSLEPESSCHDRDWIMELPMEADILTFTGIFTPEDASVASCFPFDITISLSWFPLLSIPPLHSAIP